MLVRDHVFPAKESKMVKWTSRLLSSAHIRFHRELVWDFSNVRPALDPIPLILVWWMLYSFICNTRYKHGVSFLLKGLLYRFVRNRRLDERHPVNFLYRLELKSVLLDYLGRTCHITSLRNRVRSWLLSLLLHYSLMILVHVANVLYILVGVSRLILLLWSRILLRYSRALGVTARGIARSNPGAWLVTNCRDIHHRIVDRGMLR